MAVDRPFILYYLAEKTKILSLEYNQFKIEERRRKVAALLAQSMTESEIAQELRVDQSTISRDVKALKEMSQQFIFDLARSDLAYHYKQSIDGIEEARREAWRLYSDENVTTKEKLAALRLIIESNVVKFRLLSEGPSVLAIKTLEERVTKIETI